MLHPLAHRPQGLFASCRQALTVILLCTTSTTATVLAQAPAIQNGAGVSMSIDPEDHDPALHVVIPGGPASERSFNILLPEHVTVRARGQSDAQHLYVYQPGNTPAPPHWQHIGNALQYATDFGQINFTARATLLSDGILFRYEFTNRSAVDYDMATAITDPRFHAFFYDPRLERTYVHYSSGFDLLAAGTPQRLTLPLQQWLPARYHAQFTAPIPADRVQHRDDGITYYYSSRSVDFPLIATLSTDRNWIAASFSRDPGNVWSNPELTCQHVDPQVTLPHNAHAVYEVKLLLFKGSLQDALRIARTERSSLQQTP